jgi:hypothetical protein
MTKTLCMRLLVNMVYSVKLKDSKDSDNLEISMITVDMTLSLFDS